MELKHEPNEGVSIDEDLSHTTITLTRKRGAGFLMSVLPALAIVGMGLFFDMNVWMYWFVGSLALGGLLNRVKTTVQLGDRAVLVVSEMFGRSGERKAIPYEAMASVDVVGARFGRHHLQITQLDGTVATVRHGTKADLEALALRIDARRPTGRTSDPEVLRAPDALQRMRRAE